jgi:hypothetical protein
MHFAVLSGWIYQWQQAWWSLCEWGCSWNIFACLTVVMEVPRVWRQAVEVTISYGAALPPVLSPPLCYMLHTVCVCACVRASSIGWSQISCGLIVTEGLSVNLQSLRFWTPIPVAAQSKAWVCGRSHVGIAGLNPAGSMDVCVLWVLCVVWYRSLYRADHSSRGVLPSVVCLMWYRNLNSAGA